MNEIELTSLEASIRQLLSDAGLRWILNQVDTAIEAGVSEETTITSTHQERALFDVAEASAPKRRQTKVSRNRPYSAEERLDLLFTALESATAELPLLHESLVKTLANEEDDERPPAQSATFLPDEDAMHVIPPPDLELVMSSTQRANRSELLRIISRFREEVDR